MTRLLRLVCLVWLGLGVGCAYFDNPPIPEPKESTLQVASDLPVPEGFEYLPQTSYTNDREAARRYHLVYRRPEYLSEMNVKQFVQQHFPDHGWRLDFVYGRDRTKMIFSKDQEECWVEIHEDMRRRFTEYVVEVRPRVADAEVAARAD